MLSVTHKLLILNVVMLSVIMQSVVAPLNWPNVTKVFFTCNLLFDFCLTIEKQFHPSLMFAREAGAKEKLYMSSRRD
jgi:hypothetical protein